MPPMLRAIRGATTVERDEAEEISRATQRLVAELLARNGVHEADIVSVIFTSTEDLSAAFPAGAARELGLEEVPLLGAREVAVPGSLDHCIRVLVHCYSHLARSEIRHVYLERARVLRTDLAE